MLPDNYECEGQISIFDYFGEDPKGCGKQAECEAYPIGCGGTVNPCRYGGAFKWSEYMNEPKGDCND